MEKETYMLPQVGFVRLSEVLKLIPISKTSWHDGVKQGIYPSPIKLSARSSAYRVEDIRALIDKLGSQN